MRNNCSSKTRNLDYYGIFIKTVTIYINYSSKSGLLYLASSQVVVLVHNPSVCVTDNPFSNFPTYLGSTKIICRYIELHQAWIINEVLTAAGYERFVFYGDNK